MAALYAEELRVLKEDIAREDADSYRNAGARMLAESLRGVDAGMLPRLLMAIEAAHGGFRVIQFEGRQIYPLPRDPNLHSLTLTNDLP